VWERAQTVCRHGPSNPSGAAAGRAEPRSMWYKTAQPTGKCACLPFSSFLVRANASAGITDCWRISMQRLDNSMFAIIRARTHGFANQSALFLTS